MLTPARKVPSSNFISLISLAVHKKKQACLFHLDLEVCWHPVDSHFVAKMQMSFSCSEKAINLL
jgi:hypothetical protein